MNAKSSSLDHVSVPALFRHARTTYGLAMRRALAAAGYDDIPKNGLYVIGGLAHGGVDMPLGELVRQLRVSKQAAGQLVDILVTRGYLERDIDPADRRKLTVTLTQRGTAAAAVQSAALRNIDDELVSRVGNASVRSMRRTLAALIDIGRQRESKNGVEADDDR